MKIAQNRMPTIIVLAVIAVTLYWLWPSGI
jgi:hypothetical protein